ncbi:hypothetical protein [uncultured Sphingomonas sp.]|uniref:hypothetical protein n=1 Tax=uncultured Sphingomonas sp. TaxID=158754 RepID=UPI0035C97F11
MKAALYRLVNSRRLERRASGSVDRNGSDPIMPAPPAAGKLKVVGAYTNCRPVTSTSSIAVEASPVRPSRRAAHPGIVHHRFVTAPEQLSMMAMFDDKGRHVRNRSPAAMPQARFSRRVYS